jgi:hypothetical protein
MPKPKPKPMDINERQALKDQFWGWIASDIETYSKQLDDALDAMPDDVLKRFVEERADNEEYDPNADPS